MNRENSSEHHINSERIKPEVFFRQEAEKLVVVTPEMSDDDRMRQINTKAHLLDQAVRYYFKLQETDGELKISPNIIKEPDWPNVIVTAEKMEKVNNLPWQKVDEGQHYQAERTDGSKVSAPARFFSKDRHVMLSKVIVNHEGGYTINDALQVIIGKEKSSNEAVNDHDKN